MNEFLANASESKKVEFKRWLDPATDEGKEKIVKALISMRNVNGGRLIIGLDNDGKFDPTGSNFFDLFDVDEIQILVSGFLHEPFEVKLEKYNEVGGKAILIFVPPGIETPCLTKKELKIGNKVKIKRDTFYIRTLNSNGTFSSSEGNYSDWKDVFEHCFQNRETKIAAFIKNNFDVPKILSALKAIRKDSASFLETEEEMVSKLLTQAKIELDHHLQIIGSKALDITKIDSNFGTWFVSAFPLDFKPNIPNDRKNLNEVVNQNPQYTGWPCWIKRSTGDTFQPEIRNSRWENFIHVDREDFFPMLHIDFWTMNFTNGMFSQIRILDDDTAFKNNENVPPNKFFDPIVCTWRVIESILVLKDFYHGLGFKTENILLVFSWSRLLNRKLAVYSKDYGFEYGFYGTATDTPGLIDEIFNLEYGDNKIIEISNRIVNRVTNVFGGASFPEELTAKIFKRLKEKK